MEGSIGGRMIQLMIDSGSSHNFMQEKVVKFLKLPLYPSDQFQVMVGNGQYLKGVGKCAKVAVTIQSYSFEADFFVINLHGADAILGLSWMEKLGDVTTNYQKKTMSFLYQGTPVLLKGIQCNTIEQISAKQFQKTVRTEAYSTYFMLLVEKVPEEVTTPIFLPQFSNSSLIFA